VQHSFRILAAGAGASLVAAGLLAAPAMATTAAANAAAGSTAHRPAATRTTAAARLPLTARQMLADRQAHLAARATGSVTGLAQAPDGQPLAGVCVTAYGPSGERSGVTSATGRYVIGGLRLGSYRIRYQGCDSSTAGYQAQWYGEAASYGGAAARATAPTVLVGRSGVQALAPVTLRTAAESSPLRDVINVSSPAATARSMAVAAGLPVAGTAAFRAPAGAVTASARGGRIAGRVTEPDGKPLKGICVEAVSDTTLSFGSGRTGANGRYETGRISAGSYFVVFSAGCGNNGNWVMQDRTKLVRVRSGRTTTGINAVLKLGGEISGTITNTKGHKLNGICVEPISTKALTGASGGTFLFVAGPASSVYHVHGVAPGSYKILFSTCGGSSPYAPVWWDNTESQRAAKVLRIKSGETVSKIDAAMPTGATITGVVTDASATALSGICVDAVPTGTATLLQDLSFGSSATTGSAGQYELEGLPAGSYQVYFNPGCGNDGDYVTATSATIAAKLGQTYPDVNAVLQAGATISGTVTSAATSDALPGICVFVYGGPDSYAGGTATTGTDGTYLINNQVPTGTYYVAFSGGCGNAGSYGDIGYNSPNPNAPQPITITTAGQAVTGIDAAMTAGATISGTVTTSKGQKLTGLCADASGAGGELGLAETHSGRYSIANLEPGEYQVGFGPGCGSSKEYQEEKDLASATFGSQVNPPSVSAPAGPTTGINGVLQAGGTVTGSARTKAGKSALSCVLLTGVSGAAKTDQAFSEAYAYGAYTDTGLLPGHYSVAFVPNCVLPSSYDSQWYKDKPSPAGSTRVKVVAGRTTAGISSALVKGGSIAGTITSAGKPVSGMCLYAQSISQFYDFGVAETNSAGKYVIEGLNSGRYELQLDPCGSGSADLAGALLTRIVSVTAPRRTANVNATAQLGGGISGQLLGDSPAVAQPGICVDALEANGEVGAWAVTGQDGSFELTNLPAGQYYVYFNDSICTDELNDVVSQWYPAAATEQAATQVTVTAGAVTALPTVTLASLGGISGTVSTGTGSTGLAGACVIATSSIAGSARVYAVSGSSGAYSIVGLQPGTYTVEFTSGCGASGYKAQWWKDKGSAASASPVPVSAAATTPDISATLQK
jgi:Carboxypeptidase regulatory-like domain